MRAGALSAMKLISEPLPSEPSLDRKVFLRRWLAQDEARAVKVAGLGYLSEMGIPADLEAIKVELDRNDYQTKSAAVDAIVRINLRESREKAISSLYELQPASINHDLLSAVFEKSASLNTEILLGGVAHQSPDARHTVVRLLGARRALPSDVAEQLLNDSDPKVRLDALISLVAGGRPVSEIEAKNILVKPAPSGGLGFFRAGSDGAGEAALGQFREQRLRALSDKELEEAVREDSIFDQTARFILADRHFGRSGQELRNAVDDRFKADFEQALAAMAERFGNYGADTVEKTRSLGDYIRKGLTRRALDIICNRGKLEDLGRVRKLLKDGVVDYAEADVEYLKRFGEWEDIPLIIDAVERPGPSQNGLSLFVRTEARYLAAARAIYRIGRARLPEVFVSPEIERLLPYLIAVASDRVFRDLGDAVIISLLRSKRDIVRKATALKCVQALPKTRVVKILAAYVLPGEQYYYNVVHWLDLGASLPKDRAESAAKKVIRKEWSA